MIKFGLTGGIGSGKSTISNILREDGIKVIDADSISKEVLEKNPRILDIIRTQFGAGFFDWRGEFRRKEFGNHIFRFPKQRIRYESIIMPYIREEIKNQIEIHEKSGEKLIVLDAPTLIENELHNDMDYVILVCLDTSIQVQRIISRDKISKSDATSRINSQMPMDQKKKFANIIIDNNGDLLETKKQVYDLIDFMKLIC